MTETVKEITLADVHKLLTEVRESQKEVERIVSEVQSQVAPMIEKVQTQGVMGLLAGGF